MQTTRPIRHMLLISACLAAGCAQAEGLTVGVHLVSIHSPQRTQSNTNPGLYIRKDQWQAGFYRNSYRRTSVYAGYGIPVGPVELMLGAASGYRRECTPWTDDSGTPHEGCTGLSRGALTPLAALSYAPPVSIFNVRPRFWLMPGFGKVSSVFHVSVEASL